MAFDWEHFFVLAQEWEDARSEEQSWPEARCRCIISRAYYGVWNLCREHAEASSRPVPASGNSHDNIISWFQHGETTTHKEIALYLDRLRFARVTADYHRRWRRGTPTNSAGEALIFANRVLNALGGLQ